VLFGQRSRLVEAFDDLEQTARAATLRIKGVSGKPGRHLIAGECAAHRDQVNRGEMTSNDPKEFEARHSRHVEIGDDNIRGLSSNFSQCRTPVVGRSNRKANLNQHGHHRGSNRRIVVHNQKPLEPDLLAIPHLAAPSFECLKPRSHRSSA